MSSASQSSSRPSGDTALNSVVQLVNRLQQACALLGDTAGSPDGTSNGGTKLPSLWKLLPSICVVGGQSSGKSSVLEAVVGKDFLPRGAGIVTRRPLILQLHQLADATATEYGEFLHLAGTRFTDFTEIRNEIEAETFRHLKKVGKIVSPEPIQLAVYSPRVPNLTLVDLPGLTKIAIDGQPKSIVKDLEDMVRTYIKGENSIILAVTPANADMATSDAIRMAKDVDPTGERTIGVLTKIDIVDRGVSVRDVMENQVVKLKHGWIGVVNRAQADIMANIDMMEARAKEREFFQSRADYADLPNVGTERLAIKLSSHLELAIKRQIPTIQAAVLEGIAALEGELRDLGEGVPMTKGGMVYEVLRLCRIFEEEYRKALDSGKGGGERVLSVFEGKFARALDSLPFGEIFSRENVARTISEADGYQPHLVAPEQGYRTLITQGIQLLRSPAERVVDDVHAILRAMIESVLASDACRPLRRYASLRTDIQTVAQQALDDFARQSRKMVLTLVEMEASYFTAEYFREIMSREDSRIARQTQLSGSRAAAIDNFEDVQLLRISSHVSNYVAEVAKHMQSTLPKAVVHCQVSPARKSLLEAMHKEVAGRDDPQLQRLLGEDEALMQRREDCSRRLALLHKARDEVGKVAGF